MGKKLFIALLILIAVLYLVVVVFGLVTSEDDREQQKKKQDLGAGDNALTRGIDTLLGGFAPALRVQGLRCNDQPVDKLFRLSKASPHCTLSLCGDCGDDEAEHRRGELVRYDQDLTAFLFVRTERKDRPRDCRDSLPDAGRMLQVKYTANGAKALDNPVECWLERAPGDALTLSVLSAGGDLELRCRGCEEDDPIRLRIK